MKERFGHSLIEMLVVLIIVGVLIAIAVPAVQRARESTRQAQCIHNQGQLAKAIHLHLADEPYGRFPGYRAFAADGTTAIGWAPQVFEYLGRNDMPADPTQATFVEMLACPSDQAPTNQPRLNYVGNGGQPGIDSPADGIFYDHAKPIGERVYITKDDFKDGMSNTIMLAENVDATRWNVTDEANQCILWPLVAGSEINNGVGARPSSHHPGGFVAALADGSVRFFSASQFNGDAAIGTLASVYVAMLTPGGNDIAADGAGDGNSEGGDDEIILCEDCSLMQEDPSDPGYDGFISVPEFAVSMDFGAEWGRFDVPMANTHPRIKTKSWDSRPPDQRWRALHPTRPPIAVIFELSDDYASQGPTPDWNGFNNPENQFSFIPSNSCTNGLEAIGYKLDAYRQKQFKYQGQVITARPSGFGNDARWVECAEGACCEVF